MTTSKSTKGAKPNPATLDDKIPPSKRKKMKKVPKKGKAYK